jgi:predicted nucleic acid-binding protein
MPDEWVVDASVMGAAFFEEEATAIARDFLVNQSALIAPSLLALEVAKIAAKKVWRGLTAPEVGAKAVGDTSRLVTLVESLGDLAPRAYELAQKHRFSAYDAAYLVLAEKRRAVVVTLDKKLADRAVTEGYGRLVRYLES